MQEPVRIAELLTPMRRDERSLPVISSTNSTDRDPRSLISRSTIDAGVAAVVAERMRELYGAEGKELLKVFNPELQEYYTRDTERAHFGNSPRLSEVAAVFGPHILESWMELHINDLSEFAGCRDKLPAKKTEEVARLIFGQYSHYRLTELMLFFVRFKRCEYGRFYGMVDPMIIMGALRDFAAQRRSVLEEARIRSERRTKELADQSHRELQEDYRRRVPGAYTPGAALTYTQYRLLGYYTLPDAELKRALREIAEGRRKLPTRLADIMAARGASASG